MSINPWKTEVYKTDPQPGFSTVFGIFQEYYTTHSVLQGNKGSLATVGTTSGVRSLKLLTRLQADLQGHSLSYVTGDLHRADPVSAPANLLCSSRAGHHSERIDSFFLLEASMASHRHPGRDVRHRQWPPLEPEFAVS